MDYGRALRIARAARKMSQKELAERAGIEPSFVSLIEGGKRKPSLPTVKKLALALRVPEPLLGLLAAEKGELKSIDLTTAGVLGTQLLQLLADADEERKGEGGE